MTADETQSLELHDRVRRGWQMGVVSQLAPRWFIVTWTDSDIPTIVRRDDCAWLRRIGPK